MTMQSFGSFRDLFEVKVSDTKKNKFDSIIYKCKLMYLVGLCTSSNKDKICTGRRNIIIASDAFLKSNA